MDATKQRCGQLFVELATAMERGDGDEGWAPLQEIVRDPDLYVQFPVFVADLVVGLATERQVGAAADAIRADNVTDADALADMLEVEQLMRHRREVGYRAIIERHVQGVQPKRLPFAAATLGLEVLFDASERAQVSAVSLLRDLGLAVA